MNDVIVDEVRRVRDAYAARFNQDLDAIFQDIKEREKKSGLKFVQGVAHQPAPNQALQPTGAATPVSQESPSSEAAPAAELCRSSADRSSTEIAVAVRFVAPSSTPMQYSIAKLFLVTTLAAMGFAAMRSIHFVGPLCLPVGVLILLSAGIAYPIAILTSPQKGTQLDIASNPVLPYIHMLAGVGLAFIVAFFVYFGSDPFGYLYPRLK